MAAVNGPGSLFKTEVVRGKSQTVYAIEVYACRNVVFQAFRSRGRFKVSEFKNVDSIL